MKWLLLPFLLIQVSAWAGQCTDLTKDQAIQSQLLIETASKKVPDFLVIDQYCEHCLDRYPKPIVVDEVEISHEEDIYHLSINGEQVDLAYLYVDNNNLAKQVGCKTIAVSARIGR